MTITATRGKIFEKMSMFTTFQVKAIAPQLSDSTFKNNRSGQTESVRNLDKLGAFLLEIAPHFKDDGGKPEKKRDWDNLQNFSLSTEEAFKLITVLVEEKEVSFIHKDDKQDKTKSIKFVKDVTDKGEKVLNIYLNVNEKGAVTNLSARLNDVDAKYFFNTLDKFIPILQGANNF